MTMLTIFFVIRSFVAFTVLLGAYLQSFDGESVPKQLRSMKRCVFSQKAVFFPAAWLNG